MSDGYVTSFEAYLAAKGAISPTAGTEAAIKAAAEYRDSLRLHQDQAAEPRRYGMVPASEVTHLRAEVARLTAIIEGLRDVTPQPVEAPHPLLRAIRARPGNYGLAGLAH